MSKSFKKDLTGQRFGRLTVLEFVPTDDNVSYWKCRCDCGNEVVVCRNSLHSGDTRSCGCLYSECRMTHGKTHTRLYKVWQNMKRRCFDEHNKRYVDYGGRGITVCDEWRNNFMSFYNWAIANGYTDELTIDRIDNDGNYTPENCRWSTRVEQSRNKRNNIVIEYNGEKMGLSKAAKKSGINYNLLKRRYQIGDRGERLFRPVRPHK